MNLSHTHRYYFHGISKKFTATVSRNKKGLAAVNRTFILQMCVYQPVCFPCKKCGIMASRQALVHEYAGSVCQARFASRKLNRL
jgi:hypothetical protein